MREKAERPICTLTGIMTHYKKSGMKLWSFPKEVKFEQFIKDTHNSKSEYDPYTFRALTDFHP